MEMTMSGGLRLGLGLGLVTTGYESKGYKVEK